MTYLTLMRRLSRDRNHGGMTAKPRWIARFAAFAILPCRDLLGSIDRRIDRKQLPAAGGVPAVRAARILPAVALQST